MTSTSPIWHIVQGSSPLVVAAIHDGHAARDEVQAAFALDDAGRLREEDPFSARWTTISDNRIVVNRTRFEVDMNRPRENAIYLQPEDAWGLTVWHEPPTPDTVARSLAQYDDFYNEVERLYRALIAQHGKIAVYDMHTYNHRRDGPDAPPDDPAGNPEVNVGTGTMTHDAFRPIIDSFMTDMRAYDFNGRSLDVRENIRFRGGQFGRWAHATFPESVCVLSIEFKKFFMDEWTGQPDDALIDQLGDALAATVPGVLEVLRSL